MSESGYFLVVLLMVVVAAYIFFLGRQQESFDQSSPPKVEMVVARYNEDLEWLQDEPFASFPYIVYNKSDNSDFYQENMMKEIALKNVGREGHAYLRHIVDHYDNDAPLADVTIFLPGSTDLNNKRARAEKLINSIKAGKLVDTFACTPTETSVFDAHNDFQIDNYMSSHAKNKTLNTDATMEVSAIRPFGAWYKSTYGEDATSSCATWNAMFAVTKETIRSKPKSHYESLLALLETHQNPEAIHYLERSWENVFSTTPLPKTIYSD